MNSGLLASTLSRLDLADVSGLACFDAADFERLHVLPFRPDMAVIILGPAGKHLLSKLQEMLLRTYPPTHAVQIAADHAVSQSSVAALDQMDGLPGSMCLFVPAVVDGESFESFAEVVAHLRALDGCPWDREQTHASLRPHLLEEAYETLAAIDSGEPSQLREELGDLLLQIVLHAQIASESRSFSILDVIKDIHDKIVRRHPHVFGDVEVSDVEGVLQNWERLKEGERLRKDERQGLLGGVPVVLPALAQAQEYQERAARIGFDWPTIDGVLDKIREEIDEIRQAAGTRQVSGELGDLFFALVNYARWRGLDAESVLREANRKFKHRFAHIEEHASVTGRRLTDFSLDEMDKLWSEIKRLEDGSPPQ